MLGDVNACVGIRNKSSEMWSDVLNLEIVILIMSTLPPATVVKHFDQKLSSWHRIDSMILGFITKISLDLDYVYQTDITGYLKFIIDFHFDHGCSDSIEAMRVTAP